ncbi:MAG: VRR-NUC domain-containing protein [Armatimonadota bacterium]
MNGSVHWTVDQYREFLRTGRLPDRFTPAVDEKRETVFQANVSNLFRNCGWRTYHTHDSRRSERGFPDCFFVRSDRIVVAELKTKKRNLTPEQYFWLLDLVYTGKVEVYVWYAERQEDWAEIQRVCL